MNMFIYVTQPNSSGTRSGIKRNKVCEFFIAVVEFCHAAFQKGRIQLRHHHNPAD